ncbi:MAG TPA: hypothetical protein VFZ97_10290 [Acidimicrobiales bacterium]
MRNAAGNPAAQSIDTNDAVLRATGVLMLLAIGTIHFLQIVPTTEQTPLLGVAFLGIIAASLAVAVWLAHQGSRLVWTAGATVCAAAIGGYAFTRIFSTPIDNQDVGNWSCMLGMAALFVETTLLGLSVYRARAQRLVLTAVAELPRSQRSQRRRATRGDPNAA